MKKVLYKQNLKAGYGRSPYNNIMKKIKNFLYWNFDELKRRLLALLILFTVSVSLQSLIFCIDTMPTLSGFYLGPLSLGIILDILLFAIFLALAATHHICHEADTFPVKGTAKKGRYCILCIFLMIIATYISIVGMYRWYNLALIVAVLAACSIILEKLWADDGLLYIATGIALIYCVGTYLAMLISGREPMIDTLGIVVIFLLALIAWFKPWYDVLN